MREVRLKKLVKNRYAHFDLLADDEFTVFRAAEYQDLEALQRTSMMRLVDRLKNCGKEHPEHLAERLEKEKRYIKAAQAEHNEKIALVDLKEAVERAKNSVRHFISYG